MNKKKRSSDDLVYQLKVTLKDSKPPIWRRIVVPADSSLGKLHNVLQIVMGWWDCHLHVFEIHGREYGKPDQSLELEFANEQKTRLGDIVNVKGRFWYEYDFGDSWLHQIVVEKTAAREPGKRYPICVGGARAGPPEDCGGVGGYLMFLEAITDPSHKEHKSMLEWAGGGPFDPEEFDLERINKELRRLR